DCCIRLVAVFRMSIRLSTTCVSPFLPLPRALRRSYVPQHCACKEGREQAIKEKMCTNDAPAGICSSHGTCITDPSDPSASSSICLCDENWSSENLDFMWSSMDCALHIP